MGKGAGIGNDVETDLVGENVEIRQFSSSRITPGTPGTARATHAVVAGVVRAVTAIEGALLLWIELRTAEDVGAASSVTYGCSAEIGDIIPITVTTATYYGSEETRFIRLRRGGQ